MDAAARPIDQAERRLTETSFIIAPGKGWFKRQPSGTRKLRQGPSLPLSEPQPQSCGSRLPTAGCCYRSDGTSSESPEPAPPACSDFFKNADGCKNAGCYFWSDNTCNDYPETACQPSGCCPPCGIPHREERSVSSTDARTTPGEDATPPRISDRERREAEANHVGRTSAPWCSQGTRTGVLVP